MSSACQILVHFLNFQLQKIRRISSTMSLELTLKFCNKATKPWLFVIHLSGFCHPISTFSTKPKVSSFQGVAKAFYSLTLQKRLRRRFPKVSQISSFFIIKSPLSHFDVWVFCTDQKGTLDQEKQDWKCFSDLRPRFNAKVWIRIEMKNF